MDNFVRQTAEIAHKKVWAWLRKGYLKRGTETFFLKTAQNNAIKTNYIRA